MSYARGTGDRLWSYDVTTDGSAQSFHGDMTRHEGSLLVASDPIDGHIYSFNEKNGELRWKWASDSGVSSDLFVVDDRVIAVTLANELVALNVDDGQLLWETEPSYEDDRSIPITSSPVEWDGNLVFARADGRLSCHSINDGQTVWTTTLGASPSTDLVVVGEHVVCGLADGRLIRFDPANGSVLAEYALDVAPTYRWHVTNDNGLVGLTGVEGANRRLICVDGTTLKSRWSLSPPDGEVWTIAQPALAWDHVLVGSDLPALYAIDPANGNVRWSAYTEHPPRTLRVVDDHIYIGTFDGTLNAYSMKTIEKGHRQRPSVGDHRQR